jgi:hypothetical protein
MVREVTAFQADDGTVFSNEQEALKHDALTKLKRFDIFNHASALAIANNARQLTEILAPLAEFYGNKACEEIVGEPTEESL